jgi:hypothetical protein
VLTVIAIAEIHMGRNLFTAAPYYEMDGMIAWLELFVAVVVGGVGVLILLFCGDRVLESPACTSCGYNLTGNVSGICPECGMQIEQGR